MELFTNKINEEWISPKDYIILPTLHWNRAKGIHSRSKISNISLQKLFPFPFPCWCFRAKSTCDSSCATIEILILVLPFCRSTLHQCSADQSLLWMWIVWRRCGCSLKFSLNGEKGLRGARPFWRILLHHCHEYINSTTLSQMHSRPNLKTKWSVRDPLLVALFYTMVMVLAQWGKGPETLGMENVR